MHNLEENCPHKISTHINTNLWKFKASHFSHRDVTWAFEVIEREHVPAISWNIFSTEPSLGPWWWSSLTQIYDDNSWWRNKSLLIMMNTSQDVIILCLFCYIGIIFIYDCMISLGHIYIYIYLIIMMMVYWTSSCDSPAHPGPPSWGRCCSRSHEFTGWGNHHECGPYLRLVIPSGYLT
jgi:hypothetical protein